MYEKQKEELKRAAERKAKREEKRAFLPWAKRTELNAQGKKHVSVPKILVKRKPKRTSIRRQAFNRLQAKCKSYVLLRAKIRNENCCELGLDCQGYGFIEVWYHIFPQASGNVLKYDERNILGSCARCNAGEYYSRKKKTDYHYYEDKHQRILGVIVFNELKFTQGRRQISTVEANEMADRFERMTDELKQR